MVISDEMKFPPHIHVDPYKDEGGVKSTDMVAPLKRIGDFHREWSRSRQQSGKRKEREKAADLPGGAKRVRELVEQVNKNLAAQGILLHLVLIRDAEGYMLDVYDCTNEQVATVIRDFVIDIDDLPVLVYKLEHEVGLLIDTVS